MNCDCFGTKATTYRQLLQQYLPVKVDSMKNLDCDVFRECCTENIYAYVRTPFYDKIEVSN